MRNLLSFWIVVALAAPAFGRHKQQLHPELCEIKTVEVTGNSESATVVRREIENRTWLKLSPSAEKADAVLEVAESKSTRGFPRATEQTTVSGNLIRKGEIVWSGSASFGEGVFNSGAGSAVKILLAQLKGDAGGCK